MKRTLRVWSGAALAIAVPAWLLTVPVSAQHQQQQGQSGGGSRGGGEGRATPHSGQGPSGGSSSAPSGGGSQSSGGSGGSTAGAAGGGGGYSGRADSGGSKRDGATGGSGYAMPRGGGARTSGGGSNSGGASTGGSAATPAPTGSGVSSVPVSERSGSTRDGSRAGNGRRDGDESGVPAYARPRDGSPVVGTAVPRGSVPAPPTGGGGIYVPGGYYGHGGYYGGGYYGGGYGYYDPWSSYYGFGGFYGGYYDPWYGGYPADPQGGGYTGFDEDGTLRLKVKPRDAEVYVDGYYAGQVDDFDGIFQRLHLESGPHRIEVRAAGYETLTFEVRITPDHTTTYQGEMKRLP